MFTHKIRNRLIDVVAVLPSPNARVLPNGGISVLAISRVPTDVCWPKSLETLIVKFVLASQFRHPVTRYPRVAADFFPDGDPSFCIAIRARLVACY